MNGWIGLEKNDRQRRKILSVYKCFVTLTNAQIRLIYATKGQTLSNLR